jgi:CRP-like cAMP-binding protein
MTAADFLHFVGKIPSARVEALQNEQWLAVQAQQTVACNTKHELGKRLATWLLRASDLTGWIQIPFTQDTIAKLLGMQRATVRLP